MRKLRLVLFFLTLSVIPIWKAGGTGLLTHGDSFFPFFPGELLYKLTYVWDSFILLGQDNTVVLSCIPFHSIAAGLSWAGVDLALINRLWFIIPLFLLASGIYYLTSGLYEGRGSEEASILAAIFFIFNPLVKDQLVGGSVKIIFSRAIGVFLLALIIRGLKSPRKLPYIIGIATVSIFIATDPIVGAINVILSVSYVAWYLFICRNDMAKLSGSLKFLLSSAFLALLVNLWWVLPIGYKVMTADFVSERLGESKGADILDSTKGSTNLLYVIRMMYGYDTSPAHPIHIYERTLIGPFCALLAILLAYSTLLLSSFRKMPNEGRYFYLLAVTATLFATGVNSPFRVVFLFIWDHVPLFSIFRNPIKFTYLSVIAYAYLIGYFWLIARENLGESARVIRWSYVFSIVLIIAGGWPLLTGDVTGFLKTVQVPESYQEARSFLKDARDDNQRLFILPNQNWYTQYKWSNYDMQDIATDYFFLPILSNYPGRKKILENQPDGMAYQGLYGRDESYNSAILDTLRIGGVKHVLLHRDTVSDQAEIKGLYRRLNRVEGLKYEKSLKGMDLYTVQSPLPAIYAASGYHPVFGTFDLKNLYLLERSEIEFQNSPAFAFIYPQRRFDLLRKNNGINAEPLFANDDANSFVIESAKAESSGHINPIEPGGKRPVSIKFEDGKDAWFEVDDGAYEVWVRLAGKLPGFTDTMMIGDDSYHLRNEDTAGGWVRPIIKNFKKGRYEIKSALSPDSVNGSSGSIEVLLIPENRRKSYEEALRSKKISYLFHTGPESTVKSPRDLKKTIYVPHSGSLELTVFLKPKKESLTAYASVKKIDSLKGTDLRVDQEDKGGVKPAFYTRKSETLKAAERSVWDATPAFIFDENFSMPEPFDDLGGMWRRTSDNGTVLVFNPLTIPVKADVSFSIISFPKDRIVNIVLNNEVIGAISLYGPQLSSDMEFQGDSGSKNQAKGAGAAVHASLRGVTLKPGINRITFIHTVPGELLERDKRSASGLALSEDIRIKFSDYSNESLQSKIRFADDRAGQRYRRADGYNNFFRRDEAAWSTSYLEKVDLYDFPVFALEYSSPANPSQSMEVGFRIDVDGDGKEDVYFSRTLPEGRPGINRFEINLLEEVRKIFPEDLVRRVYLSGMDYIPKRRWGAGVHSSKGEAGNYAVRRVEVISKESSAVVTDVGFGEVDFSHDPDRLLNDDKDLVFSFNDSRLGRNGLDFDLEIALNSELLEKNHLMILPLKIPDDSTTSLSLWVGYDSSDSKRADLFLPFGKKALLEDWVPEGNKNGETSLYGAHLPQYCSPDESSAGAFKGMTILKSTGAPSVSGRRPQLRTEKFNVENGKVGIKVPGCADPKDSVYELYCIPDGWIRESSRFEGYKEYIIDFTELQESYDTQAKPVELKFHIHLAQKENAFNGDHTFNFKAPLYAHTVPASLKYIPQTNAPVISIDNKKVDFIIQDRDEDKNEMRITSKIWLDEGEHQLDIRGYGALDAVVVKLVSEEMNAKDVNAPPEIKFKKINPTRYIVNVKGAVKPFTLIFSETFQGGWHAYIRKGDKVKGTEPRWALWSAWEDGAGRVEVNDHFIINGFANGWVIPVEDNSRAEGEEFQILLEYKPQRLFEAGVLISSSVFLAGIVVLGYKWRRQKG